MLKLLSEDICGKYLKAKFSAVAVSGNGYQSQQIAA